MEPDSLTVLLTSPQAVWLYIGVALVVLEVTLLGGVGLLFGGLAAIVTGILIEMEAPGSANVIGQCGWFFFLTTLWAALLWKPLKRFRMPKGGDAYHNMVGDFGEVVGGPLVKGTPGMVRWSGTNVSASLSTHVSANELAPGTRVRIMSVKGNVFTVEPIS